MLPAGSVADPATEPESDWEFTGDATGDKVGYSVSTAGDVNGDGCDDVLIGAPMDHLVVEIEGEEVTFSGAVYVFYGSDYGGLGTGSIPDVSLRTESSARQQGSWFGASVSSAGDVNNDGWDDVIVGAPEYKAEAETRVGNPPLGGIFLYLGSPTGLSSTPQWYYLGAHKDADLGRSVSGAGDVNNDGWDDVIAGEPGFTDDPENPAGKGAVLVFHGSELGLSVEPDWVFISDQRGSQLGYSVGSAGDLNNDTYDDLIVGARGYDQTEPDEGAAFVFLGSGSGPGTSPVRTLYGGQEGALFGTSVGPAGKVDGDPYAEIIVGAPHYDGPLGDEGAAFAFCGNASDLGAVPCWTRFSDQTGSLFGTSVGGAGDVDADGYDDVIVGAPLYQPLPDKGADGAAFVFFGSSSGLRPWVGWTAANDKNVKEEQSAFAFAVGTAGDVNDDDADDILAGAPAFFVSQLPLGRAFAFYGPLEPVPVHQTFLPLVAR